MKKLALSIALVALVSLSVTAAPKNVNIRKIGTVVFSGWESLLMSSDGVVATGGSPELKTTDGSFFAKADKLTVHFNKASKGKILPSGVDAIKSAELIGNVTFSAHPQEGQSIKGNGARLTINGSEHKATLDGEGKTVHVEAMDPAMFDAPADLDGDVILINLRPGLTPPDDWRLKVQSKSDKSRLGITPKSRAETNQGK